MSDPDSELELEVGEYIPAPATTTTAIDPALLNDPDALLDALNKARIEAVNNYAGMDMADPKYASLRLKAMKDAGDQVLAQRRLVLEEDAAQSDKEIAQSLAEISTRLARGSDGHPFARKIEKGGSVALPEKVNRKDLKINPTTMNESATKVTYDQFMDEHYKEDEA